MSLHRYVVPPPLALAVEPAPPLKPHKDNKGDDNDKNQAEKDAEQKDEKGKDGGKAAGGDPPKVVADKGGVADGVQRSKAGAGGEATKSKPIGVAAKQSPTPANDFPATPANESPATPDTGGSMIPEPPTPVLDTAAKENDPNPVPSPRAAQDRKAAKEDEYPATGTVITADDPKLPTKSTGEDEIDDQKDAEEPEPKPELLRLVGPVPPRPIRTRLTLNPAKPYPLVNTDPRGAYFKYARGVQAEWILVDVAKDGWLVEQWRERPEREAIARLRGEADRQRDREVEAIEHRTKVRKVPKTSEEIILDLWNDLAQAPNYEVSEMYIKP